MHVQIFCLSSACLCNMCHRYQSMIKGLMCNNDMIRCADVYHACP
jgi:hypothetical protein